MNPAVEYRIENIHHSEGWGVIFSLRSSSPAAKALDIQDITLPIPGSHNAHNASAALAVIHLLGLPYENAVSALEKYSGTGRRYDIQGIANGITVIDDYAHHPTEIRATLSAARCQFPDREIWAVWQPHTYSRTRA